MRAKATALIVSSRSLSSRHSSSVRAALRTAKPLPRTIWSRSWHFAQRSNLAREMPGYGSSSVCRRF